MWDWHSVLAAQPLPFLRSKAQHRLFCIFQPAWIHYMYTFVKYIVIYQEQVSISGESCEVTILAGHPHQERHTTNDFPYHVHRICLEGWHAGNQLVVTKEVHLVKPAEEGGAHGTRDKSNGVHSVADLFHHGRHHLGWSHNPIEIQHMHVIVHLLPVPFFSIGVIKHFEIWKEIRLEDQIYLIPELSREIFQLNTRFSMAKCNKIFTLDQKWNCITHG